jgi:hypothetical protein
MKIGSSQYEPSIWGDHLEHPNAPPSWNPFWQGDGTSSKIAIFVFFWWVIPLDESEKWVIELEIGEI